VLAHTSSFDDPEVARSLVAAIDGETNQTIERRVFGSLIGWRLAEPAEAGVTSAPAARPVPDGAFRLSSSSQAERLALALDGRASTRWISGESQSGDEWIEVQLDRHRDIAGVRFLLTPDSFGDYPRSLAIDSVSGHGDVERLFESDMFPRFLPALIENPAETWLGVDLAPNSTLVLRIRQTGRTRAWQWSIHELRLTERAL
jgi:hypothetical protein